MSAFDDADAALPAGVPFPALAEPALFLLASALGTFGRAIGNADPFDALGFRRRLVLCRNSCDSNRKRNVLNFAPESS
jgi:hypothetical protein